ncbi:MAG: stage II sporulation protein M [Nanoarchaeota archaeon]|nr:stage II sporulation protein M [Nanoarchaeota archaeon]
MKQKKRVKKNLGKGKFSLNQFVYSNYKLSLKTLKDAKNYVWFATILFFSFILIGFLFPVFFQQQIYDFLKEIFKQTEGLDTWNMIRFIFMNNLKSSFFAIFCGVLFGIIPFAVLVANGYVIGFVVNKTVASEGALVLWRLLPHGIFELPAVLISIGVGLRLGMFLFVYKEKNKLREFGKWLIDSLRVFIFIVVPLLVIAAIIEGSLIIFLG